MYHSKLCTILDKYNLYNIHWMCCSVDTTCWNVCVSYCGGLHTAKPVLYTQHLCFHAQHSLAFSTKLDVFLKQLYWRETTRTIRNVMNTCNCRLMLTTADTSKNSDANNSTNVSNNWNANKHRKVSSSAETSATAEAPTPWSPRKFPKHALKIKRQINHKTQNFISNGFHQTDTIGIKKIWCHVMSIVRLIEVH